MATSRLRAMALLGGMMLSSAGCMVPVYRMPAGYSGSYHRYLNRTVGTPAAAPSEIGNRPSVTAATTGPTTAPFPERPPIPPRP